MTSATTATSRGTCARRSTTPLLALASLVIAGLFGVPMAGASTVSELARIRGQGESVLQGLGLVVGLSGTGDSGRELVVARPLAEVLRRNGNPIANFEELRNTRSVALVMVTCVIPEAGARVDDRFDVRVSVLNSSTSLAGGELYVSPLTAAVPGGALYAFAQGSVVIEDDERPTVGIVRRGARLVRDIQTTPDIRDRFDLIIDPHFAGWSAAAEIASNINQQYLLTTRQVGEPVAVVVDDRTIRVRVPDGERRAPAGFIGDVLATDVNTALLKLPAQVVCNTRTGAIVVTGDVRISPAVITHQDLVITTTVPPIEPTPQNPEFRQERWTTVETGARPAETARLQDLIAAFRQLDVSPKDQIQILQMLHRAGKLHARLIIE